MLRAVGALDQLASEHHIFTSLADAIDHAYLHATAAPYDADRCAPNDQAA